MENKYNQGKALPVEKRLEIYKRALKWYKSGEEKDGFCFSLSWTLSGVLSTFTTVYVDEHKYLLPELWKFRTYKTKKESKEAGDQGYWYRNNEERIEALEKAIKLLTTK